MVIHKEGTRVWGVVCLGCKHVIPLSAAPSGSASGEQMGGEGMFRTWCRACGREFPYSTRQILAFERPGFPVSFQRHPVVDRVIVPPGGLLSGANN